MRKDELLKKAVEFLSSRDGAATQSELWKELGLDSKRGSRVAIALEKMGVVTREKVLKDGRWTFLLRVVNNDMDLDIIIRAPCLTCKNEKFCGRSTEVTPEKCDLLEKWILNDYRKKRVRKRTAKREKHAEEK